MYTYLFVFIFLFFFFKQKTAYEMRISDWSSDVCSSDLPAARIPHHHQRQRRQDRDLAAYLQGADGYLLEVPAAVGRMVPAHRQRTAYGQRRHLIPASPAHPIRRVQDARAATDPRSQRPTRPPQLTRALHPCPTTNPPPHPPPPGPA